MEATPVRLVALVDKLAAQYEVPTDLATTCVTQAWEAVRYFGAAADDSMVDLVGVIATRELRLRLGLEREVARLDPEDHHR